jgi:hypothetical protein
MRPRRADESVRQHVAVALRLHRCNSPRTRLMPAACRRGRRLVFYVHRCLCSTATSPRRIVSVRDGSSEKCHHESVGWPVRKGRRPSSSASAQPTSRRPVLPELPGSDGSCARRPRMTGIERPARPRTLHLPTATSPPRSRHPVDATIAAPGGSPIGIAGCAHCDHSDRCVVVSRIRPGAAGMGPGCTRLCSGGVRRRGGGGRTELSRQTGPRRRR